VSGIGYIGSKARLLPLIESVARGLGGDLRDKTFCDLFAGTGCVAAHFKPLCASTISNDIEPYAYTLLAARMDGGGLGADRESMLAGKLNSLPPQQGLVHRHCSKGGSGSRMYFTDGNAMRIDAARQAIETWKANGTVSEAGSHRLLAALLHAADRVANTAATYVSYLKQFKKTALAEMEIKPLPPAPAGSGAVRMEPAEDLVSRVEGDILYLDPPYNARHYGLYYHVLNLITLYDPRMQPKGVTGNTCTGKSAWTLRDKVPALLDNLILRAKFRHVLLSYSAEGLIPPSQVRAIMGRHGRYDRVEADIKRFKQDAARDGQPPAVTEYLHILEKKT